MLRACFSSEDCVGLCRRVWRHESGENDTRGGDVKVNFCFSRSFREKDKEKGRDP